MAVLISRLGTVRDFAARPWRRPLALMHIPKTAGTSLMESIHAALKPGLDLRGFDPCLFGDFRDWDSMTPALRQHIYLTADAMPRNAGVVMGHFAYSTLVARYPRARLVTFLREPQCRLLSHFVYWRCQTDEVLAPSGPVWAARVATARGSLHDFLADPRVAAQTDNVALRMLLWPHPDIPEGGFIDPRHDAALLAAARVRLRHFAYVGFVEAEGGIYPGLARWLGRPLEIKHLNETPLVPEDLQTSLPDQMTRQAMALLRARSRLSLQLWQEIAGRTRAEAAVQELRRQTIQHTTKNLAARMSPRQH